MSSRERIHHISCITNKSLQAVLQTSHGDHLVFHRERRGREAIVANGVYGGNSRKLIANKPPMRGGGGS